MASGWFHVSIRLICCRAVAYVCQNFTCQAPTSDPERVRELLGPSRGGPPDGDLGTPRLTQVDISTLTKS